MLKADIAKLEAKAVIQKHADRWGLGYILSLSEYPANSTIEQYAMGWSSQDMGTPTSQTSAQRDVTRRLLDHHRTASLRHT
eukprot:scaffold123480_cov48-Prasinocladus_malaysianus.AAC.1